MSANASPTDYDARGTNDFSQSWKSIGCTVGEKTAWLWNIVARRDKTSLTGYFRTENRNP